LEEYAAAFDELFVSVAQRRGFRECLTGLLAPRERNKTLTALAGAEPVAQASHPAVQRLQYFVSESPWDAERINETGASSCWALIRLPVRMSAGGGDDSGDRKDGHAMAHVARQYLGSVGKTDNGIVVVCTLWADERVYYPLHVAPYTPAGRLPGGASDPEFATKPQLAIELARRARTAGIPFAALVADSWYGDNPKFVTDLERRCCALPDRATRWGRVVPGSDRHREFGERCGDPRGGRGVESEFVVSAAEVLDEGMSGDDHLCGSVGAQPAHRSEPVFQSTVIGVG